jgi:hypothetical protein
MGALSQFLGTIIRQRDVLLQAISADAEALRYAEVVWKNRRQPPTEEDRKRREREFRECIEQDLLEIGTPPEEAKIQAAHPSYVLIDPESYLCPYVYQHGDFRIERPPQITEEDVKRYAWRHGESDDGKSRTAPLLATFRPSVGFSEVHRLFRETLAEAEARGLSSVIAGRLEQAYDAHEALLNAAWKAEEDGDRQIAGDVFARHCDAISPLLKFLPPEEQDQATDLVAKKPWCPRSDDAKAVVRCLEGGVTDVDAIAGRTGVNAPYIRKIIERWRKSKKGNRDTA